MKLKELIALGIDEEIAKKIIIMHGKNIEHHKALVVTATEEKDAVDTQLTAANKQIADLEKMDPEALKIAVADWETKGKKYVADAKEAAKTAAANLASVEQGHALEAKVTKAGAINSKAVIALLNMDKTTFKDGEFSGLDEQFEALRKSDGNQFNEVADEEGDETPEIDKVSGLKIIKSTKSTSSGGDAMMNAAMTAAGVADEGDKK